MCPTKGDIIRRLTARLGQDVTPATMNESPEGEIRGKVFEIILERYAEAITIMMRTPPIFSANRYI